MTVYVPQVGHRVTTSDMNPGEWLDVLHIDGDALFGRDETGYALALNTPAKVSGGEVVR